MVNPLPAPNNTFQGGAADAFVARLSFNSATSTLSLAYSTYLGASDWDQGNAVAVDSAGNAYVTGLTRSPGFPLVHPLPAPNNVIRSSDAFASTLSFDGATSSLSLAWSTGLGGTNPDLSSNRVRLVRLWSEVSQSKRDMP
jgi:hypothetical protein